MSYTDQLCTIRKELMLVNSPLTYFYLYLFSRGAVCTVLIVSVKPEFLELTLQSSSLNWL